MIIEKKKIIGRSPVKKKLQKKAQSQIRIVDQKGKREGQIKYSSPIKKGSFSPEIMKRG